METGLIIEEQIMFPGQTLPLSGILAYPTDRQPERTVLLCSPHPHFAGNMENNVIQELARWFATDSVTLRFDYRGVGKSQIDLPKGLSVFDYWQQTEDLKDYGDAVVDVKSAAIELLSAGGRLPCVVIGYSFGVVSGFHACMNNPSVSALVGIAPPTGKVDFKFLKIITKPCRLIIGTDDFLYSSQQIDSLINSTGPGTTVNIWHESDHFFRNEEKKLAKEIESFIHEQVHGDRKN